MSLWMEMRQRLSFHLYEGFYGRCWLILEHWNVNYTALVLLRYVTLNWRRNDRGIVVWCIVDEQRKQHHRSRSRSPVKRHRPEEKSERRHHRDDDRHSEYSRNKKRWYFKNKGRNYCTARSACGCVDTCCNICNAVVTGPLLVNWCFVRKSVWRDLNMLNYLTALSNSWVLV